MGFVIDLVGERFGRLLVLKQVAERTKGRQVKWECLCDCGKTSYTLGNRLKRGTTKSCGCLSAENLLNLNTTHGQNRRSGSTGEYMVWANMKYRCLNPKYKEYHLYGGRGITVCDRWLSFENFFADMGKRPTPKHTLGRYPNVDGNYEPSNCRWATVKQQMGNKRNNKWIEFNDRKMIQADWAKYLGTTPQILWTALKTKSFESIYNFYKNKNLIELK